MYVLHDSFTKKEIPIIAKSDTEAVNEAVTLLGVKKAPYMRTYPHPEISGVVVFDFGLHNKFVHKKVSD